ncbi:hypothetical protein VKT23_017463 [Stygiomarasmius scandens]|uniref:Aquaporin n=1 Tax=Marasmiellus scandens TaxID=2682957 RepID=A0ABR1IRW0_9AGAR
MHPMINSTLQSPPSYDLESLRDKYELETPTHSSFIRESRLWKARQWLREPAAEFAGVMILVIFGAGVGCQVNLSTNTGVASSPKGDYATFAFGWAIGATILTNLVWFSAGISGGHVNPAVTLSLAIFRDFSWRKVPGKSDFLLQTSNLISIVYIFSQLLGGIVGAGIVYANYFHAIDIVEGGHGARTLTTAGIFSTFAAEYETNGSAFFSEFLATAMLLITVLAATDKHRNPPTYVFVLPFIIFLFTLGLGIALGINTGFAINPARDLGPRIFMGLAGYSGEIWSFRQQYWLWCPVIAPFLGAISGTVFYDLIFYTGRESWIVRVMAPSQTSDNDIV